MTPHATLGPAFPALRLASFPPLPRSSSPPWMTMALPPTKASEFGSSDNWGSEIMIGVKGLPLRVRMSPRSPTWRSTSVGAPWFFCKHKAEINSCFCFEIMTKDLRFCESSAINLTGRIRAVSALSVSFYVQCRRSSVFKTAALLFW